VSKGPLLEVRNLRVEFPTRRGTLVAVDDISLSIEPGEVLGVVGESGAGKSMTGAAVIGLLEPPGRIASGEVKLNGLRIDNLPYEDMRKIRGREIGAIFQDPLTSLNPLYTVGQQLVETITTHLNMSTSKARTRAIELLASTGIPAPDRRIDHYPHQFSGGMRQRVMIAMMMACNPLLLIADEPTTALDVTIQAQIVDLAMRMRDRMDMAMFWITHDLGVVAGMADRVIVMYAGRVVEEASVFDLYGDPRHPYTLALLSALPRADQRREKKLRAIPGSPPNLLMKPRGCPFAPRCDSVLDRCWSEQPPLEPVALHHKAACWVDVTTGRPQ
jgi:oligopeptide/dipeptide ABC transporter ATP-binding protein